MPIHLQFTLTFNDYLDAQRLHAKRGWWPRLNLALCYTLIPAMGVICVILGFLISGNGVPWGVFLFVVGTGLCLIAYPFYLRMRWKRFYLRTRGGWGDCSIDFDTSRIKTQDSSMKSEIEWPAIRSFSEGKKMYLLYVAPAKFLIVPKRVCTEHQIEELRSLFKQEIGAVHR